MKFVEANGLCFAYLEWRPETPFPAAEPGPRRLRSDRTELVLAIHGFPDTPHTWSVIGPELAAQGYRVVAPFLRGYAPSGMPARDTTTTMLGEDTVALITALGEQRAHLLGHDWGAEAVYAAAGLAPERIITLTAVGIPHRAAVLPTPKLGWALRHFLTLTLPGAEKRFASADFAELELLIRRWSPTWNIPAEELATIKDCFHSPGTVHGALGYYRAASVFPPAFLKKKVPVPSLNFAGRDDPGVSPAIYEATRTHYTAGFEVAVIGGGHFCHRESAPELISRLLGFLAASHP